MTDVTRVNGSSRDPYPPTTVSLLTNPRSDFKSASTTRIGHLNLTQTQRRGLVRPEQGDRVEAAEKMALREGDGRRNPRGRRAPEVETSCLCPGRSVRPAHR